VCRNEHGQIDEKFRLPRRLMLDSGVLHILEKTEALEMKRVFPRMLHRLRSSGKACKNNLLRQI
jgi:hypothetical protein